MTTSSIEIVLGAAAVTINLPDSKAEQLRATKKSTIWGKTALSAPRLAIAGLDPHVGCRSLLWRHASTSRVLPGQQQADNGAVLEPSTRCEVGYTFLLRRTLQKWSV